MLHKTTASKIQICKFLHIRVAPKWLLISVLCVLYSLILWNKGSVTYWYIIDCLPLVNLRCCMSKRGVILFEGIMATDREGGRPLIEPPLSARSVDAGLCIFRRRWLGCWCARQRSWRMRRPAPQSKVCELCLKARRLCFVPLDQVTLMCVMACAFEVRYCWGCDIFCFPDVLNKVLNDTVNVIVIELMRGGWVKGEWRVSEGW